MIDGASGVKFSSKTKFIIRTSVKTPASYGLGYAGVGIDSYFLIPSDEGLKITGREVMLIQGVYTPVSTFSSCFG